MKARWKSRVGIIVVGALLQAAVCLAGMTRSGLSYTPPQLLQPAAPELPPDPAQGLHPAPEVADLWMRIWHSATHPAETVNQLWAATHARVVHFYDSITGSPITQWLAAAPHRCWQAANAIGADAAERLQEAHEVAAANFHEVYDPLSAGVVVRAGEAKQVVLHWPAVQAARGAAVQGYAFAAAHPLPLAILASAVAIAGAVAYYLEHHRPQAPTEHFGTFTLANESLLPPIELTIGPFETRFRAAGMLAWLDNAGDYLIGTLSRTRQHARGFGPAGAWSDAVTNHTAPTCTATYEEWSVTDITQRPRGLPGVVVGKERTSASVGRLAAPVFGGVAVNNTRLTPPRHRLHESHKSEASQVTSANSSVAVSAKSTSGSPGGPELALDREIRHDNGRDNKDNSSSRAESEHDDGSRSATAELGFVFGIQVCAAATGAEVLLGRRTCRVHEHGPALGAVMGKSRRRSTRSASAAGPVVKPVHAESPTPHPAPLLCRRHRRTTSKTRATAHTDVNLSMGPEDRFGTLPRRSRGCSEAVQDRDSGNHEGEVLTCAADGVWELYMGMDADVCSAVHLCEALPRSSREGFKEVHERGDVAAVASDSSGAVPSYTQKRGPDRKTNVMEQEVHDLLHMTALTSDGVDGDRPGSRDVSLDTLRQVLGRSRGLTQGVRGRTDVVRPIENSRDASHGDQPPRRSQRSKQAAGDDEDGAEAGDRRERQRRRTLPGLRTYAAFRGRGAAVAGYFDRCGRRRKRITLGGAAVGVFRVGVGLGVCIFLVALASVGAVLAYRRRLRMGGDAPTSHGPTAAGDGQGPADHQAQTADNGGAVRAAAATGQAGAGAGGPGAGAASPPANISQAQARDQTGGGVASVQADARGDPAGNAGVGGGGGGGTGADQQQPGPSKKKKKKKNGKKAASQASSSAPPTAATGAADGAQPGARSDGEDAKSGDEQSGTGARWHISRETLPLGAATTDIPATVEKLMALLDQAPTSSTAKRALFELLYELVTTTVFDARYINYHVVYKERRQEAASAEEVDEWCARQVASHAMETVIAVDTVLDALRTEEEKVQAGAAATHDGVVRAGQQQGGGPEAAWKAVEEKVVAERDRLLMAAACGEHGYRRMYRVLCETGDVHKKRVKRFKTTGSVFGED